MGKEVQRRLRTILVRLFGALVAVIAILLFIHRIANPNDLNHILIINRSGTEVPGPIQVELIGDDGVNWSHSVRTFLRPSERVIDTPDGLCDWSPSVDTPIGFWSGSAENCAVSNLDHAFFPGKLCIRDVTGTVRFVGRVRPRGRYCGTMVVVILPDGGFHRIQRCTFNRIATLAQQSAEAMPLLEEE